MGGVGLGKHWSALILILIRSNGEGFVNPCPSGFFVKPYNFVNAASFRQIWANAGVALWWRKIVPLCDTCSMCHHTTFVTFAASALMFVPLWCAWWALSRWVIIPSYVVSVSTEARRTMAHPCSKNLGAFCLQSYLQRGQKSVQKIIYDL